MVAALSNAISAYADAAKRMQGASHGLETSAPSAAKGPSFADMLADAGHDGLALGRSAEGLSAASLSGSAELADVVTAVTNTEITLQTVLSIRDRVVSSLQEIMRMPI
jgi:flagellar hook-basal body complex protein FliE